MDSPDFRQKGKLSLGFLPATSIQKKITYFYQKRDALFLVFPSPP